ncbi:TetR/AcrR family transcriptional regulator [Pseudonocardia sp. NPDC049635]|uniref:TetR/AcrR family transcriptional regulator n=1 Tax=Pseudonocardia sp. NPDC049635 TaxID=3155506 RepID=UPI0033D20A8C
MVSIRGPEQERVRYRGGRAVLTRSSIGRTVLDLIAEGGVGSVTMRSLAERLGVTPRALYKVVADRADALMAASVLAQGEWQAPVLDPADWEASVAEFCQVARAWYRRYPGILTLSQSADVTDEVHPQMLLNNERCFAFLSAVGLSPADTLRAWELIIGTVAGFAEIEEWDARTRRNVVAAHGEEQWQPTPARLLESHSDLDLTHTHRILGADTGTPEDRIDQRFADLVEMLVCWIDRRRPVA